MQIDIQLVSKSKIESVDFDNLTFGNVFTDHMLECDFVDGKWQQMKIKPYGPISLDPSAKVFHYGQAVFEGMKAYKSQDDRIWMFRPEENIKRLNLSSERLSIPAFSEQAFFEGLNTLLKIDKDWISKEEGSSLYIRPFVIATEHGVSANPAAQYKFMIILSPAQSYYSGEVKVIFADHFSRSAPGGVGFAKCAGNYAGQFYPTSLAQEKGYQQIVWTDSGEHKYLEEAGTMNIFFRVGDKLLTAPTSDRILDGITRKSIIQMAEDMGVSVEVRPITVFEIEEAAKTGELKEMFGSGTAAVVNKIAGFSFAGQDYELPQISDSYADVFKEKITSIQTKRIEDPFGWTYEVK